MKNKEKQQPAWLAPALDYVQDWLAFQVERYKQPGCTVAIARGPELVAEYAFGQANLRTGERLDAAAPPPPSPSHTKTFTASGVLLLREQGRLGLDDAIGHHVHGLHKDVARPGSARRRAALARRGLDAPDGADSGQFQDRPPLPRAQSCCGSCLRTGSPRARRAIPEIFQRPGYGRSSGLMIEQLTRQATTRTG